MAHAGARGETEAQMGEVMHFRLAQERLPPAFKALDLLLASRAGSGGKEGFELNIANSVWVQEGHGFLADYLDILAGSYGGEARRVDFRTAPQDAVRRINDWVSKATKGRIDQLVSPDSIDKFTRLVLANAVYFKAEWIMPFGENSTTRRTFFGLGGGESRTPMMRQMARFAYGQGQGYQALELGYKGGEVAMTLLVPDARSFTEFESSLDSHMLAQVLAEMEQRQVRLTMPKFGLEASFKLAETLQRMGMANAFDDEAAEFQGMNGLSCLERDDECLYISEVAHRAVVTVDEAGTEASAATAVIIMTPTSIIPGEPVELTIDRPFIFLVRDRATGAVLFMGRVVEL